MNRNERLEGLRINFDRGVSFHLDSFEALERKSKYWLTLSLPSLLGAVGALVQNESSISQNLEAFLASVATCLFVAIFCLGRSIVSTKMSSGIAAPPGWEYSLSEDFLETDEKWREFEELRAKLACEAFAFNEQQNVKKAKLVSLGEELLFFGIPLCLLAVGIGLAISHTALPACVATIVPSLTGGGVVGALIVLGFVVRHLYLNRS